MKNNNFLAFIPLLFLGSAITQNSSKGYQSIKINDIGQSVNDFVKDFSSNLTMSDVNESISTLKKIGPYLPEPYVEKINTLSFNFEKINKINELVEFLSKEQDPQMVVTSQNLSTKERFNKILITLKDDIPEEKIKNVRPFIDIVANFDNYKNMARLLSTMNSGSGNSEEKMETMINTVVPLLGQNEETAEKMKSMIQMFQMLSSSSKEKNTDEDKDNTEYDQTNEDSNDEEI